MIYRSFVYLKPMGPLVLLWNFGLVLRGWPAQIEVIGVLGICIYILIYLFFNLFTYQLVDFFQFLTNTFGQAVEDRFALETPECKCRFFLEVPTDWVYWLNTWILYTYTSKGVGDYECLLRSEKPLGRETQLGAGAPLQGWPFFNPRGLKSKGRPHPPVRGFFWHRQVGL